MTSRTRSYSKSIPKGTATWTFGGNFQQIGGSYPRIVDSGFVSDEVQNGDNNPFHTQTLTIKGGLISGHSPSVTDWSNYFADGYDFTSVYAHHVAGDSPTNSEAANKGVGMTNPSTPYSNLPVDIAKLGEAAELLRADGYDIIAELGNHWLKYKFQIEPIVRDLVRWYYFKHRLNKRCNDIIQLQSAGGLRRTVSVYKGSNAEDDLQYGGYNVQSNFGFFVVPWRRFTSEEVRVHCRWLPQVSFPWDYDDGNVVNRATRSLLASGFNMKLIWDITPWSWLINWATNLGSFIAANNNSLNCYLSYCTVMRHRRTELWGGLSNKDGTAQCEPMHAVLEDRDRMLWPITPTATLPFLDEEQLGIVSALAAQRHNPLSLRL